MEKICGGVAMESLKNMEKGYIKIDKAAEKWGVTPRRVQALCSGGKIDGAVRMGREWFIPERQKSPVTEEPRTQGIRRRRICHSHAELRLYI